ncbi:MAG: hypothetical protein CMK59_02510 [Proteobacteria bacterium]|nr:hypothetical protein [Pseudomonadota bacterium]
MKRLLFSLVPLLGLLLLAIGGEFVLRLIPLSKERAQFLFFTEYKISRWHYLNGLLNRLLIDEVLKTKPNHSHTEHPEPRRPPFDRVPHPYTINTNEYGFRDASFKPKSLKKRIIVVGDSVAFGKGVLHSESFPELLEKNSEAEVYNLGLQGCTAECQWRLLNRYANELKPDLLIIQASGNDLDQSLWKATYAKEIPGLGLSALESIQKSHLLMEILRWRGSDQIAEQFNAARTATDRRYGPFVDKILSKSAELNLPTIALNLPFAYGWNYGEHVTSRCNESPLCTSVDIVFPQDSSPYQNPLDFVGLTAQEMNITEQELAPVFPFRTYFYDVCHLSPKGHQYTSENILQQLKERALP